MVKKVVNWFEINNKISWLITILLALFIFYMSSRTFPPGIPGISIGSYVYHFGIYFVFGFFLFISITKGKLDKKYLVFIAILAAIGYGISDEIHQFFVPSRYCCYEDVLTDAIGILSSGIVYTGINFKK
ncbi:MAG: VanZ family protein [Candidatus Nanoarchaeia archaeon]|nr:VanZ family protein [Candidatus Nanoarchaeia archaeon]